MNDKYEIIRLVDSAGVREFDWRSEAVGFARAFTANDTTAVLALREDGKITALFYQGGWYKGEK